MKKPCTALALLLASGLAAEAGVIHGTITRNGAPVANAQVIIAPENQPATAPVQTNERGRYSVNVKQQGKCVLTVSHSGATMQFTVASYADPVQYDFEIVRDPKGEWILRRK